MEPPLCVVSSWVIRVYTILVWNTISGSSNPDNCFYHCLILISISHLKALFNLLLLLLLLLLLFIIYIVNLHMVRPRFCRVIYYFDTPVLGRRHQSFGRVKELCWNDDQLIRFFNTSIFISWLVLMLSNFWSYPSNNFITYSYFRDFSLLADYREFSNFLRSWNLMLGAIL